MLLRFIDSTALLSIKWTLQTLNNVDWTHVVLQDSATKKLSADQVKLSVLKSAIERYEYFWVAFMTN